MATKNFCDICEEEMDILPTRYVTKIIPGSFTKALDICNCCWKLIEKTVKKMREEGCR
jgi:hypothetical protein